MFRPSLSSLTLSCLLAVGYVSELPIANANGNVFVGRTTTTIEVYTNRDDWKAAMDAAGSSDIVKNDFSPLLEGEKEDYVKLKEGPTDAGAFSINLSDDWLDNWIWTDDDDNVRYEGRYTNDRRGLKLDFDGFGTTGRACGFAGVWKQYTSERGELAIRIVSDDNDEDEDEDNKEEGKTDDDDDAYDDVVHDLPWGIVSSTTTTTTEENVDGNDRRSLKDDNDDDSSVVNISDLLDKQKEQFVGIVVRDGFEKIKFETDDRTTLFDLYDVELSVDCSSSPSVSPAPTDVSSPSPSSPPSRDKVAYVYTDFDEWKTAADERGLNVVDNELSPLLDGEKDDYLLLEKGSTDVGSFDVNLDGDRLENWIWTDNDKTVKLYGSYSDKKNVRLKFDNFEGGRACAFAGTWMQYKSDKGDLSFRVVTDVDDEEEEEDKTDDVGGLDVVDDDDDDGRPFPWDMMAELRNEETNDIVQQDNKDDSSDEEEDDNEDGSIVNVGDLLTGEQTQFVGIIAPRGFEELRFVEIDKTTSFDLFDIKLSMECETSPSPTDTASSFPSGLPSSSPSSSPSGVPTSSPSSLPSATPSSLPTDSPSRSPTSSPSIPPSAKPTVDSESPSAAPTTTVSPSSVPTVSAAPSVVPSFVPSSAPSVSAAPSSVPSVVPSASPAPSAGPTSTPSVEPSSTPSSAPSSPPSSAPSVVPSVAPSVSSSPSTVPVTAPSAVPSPVPSVSAVPSTEPSSEPSTSAFPSREPSTGPTASPVPTASPQPSTPLPSKSPKPSTSPSDAPPPGVFDLLEAIAIRILEIFLELLGGGGTGDN